MKRRTPAQIARDQAYYKWSRERSHVTARMTAALATYIQFEVEGFEGWRRAQRSSSSHPPTSQTGGKAHKNCTRKRTT